MKVNKVAGIKPIVEMRNIVKTFSGVKALSNITFDVLPGEIHCLVGENGAGKSTLMKVLSGAYSPDSGEIIFEGIAYKNLTPELSQRLGINIIYQENLLAPTMNVVENVFIGSEIKKNKIFNDFDAMKKAVVTEMNNLGININIEKPIEKLSVADQQFVKILKAIIKRPKVLIMDEPTSMFNVEDAKKVLRLVKRISDMGIGIIYISHFLSEVVEIADRITVIRDGAVVNSYDNSKRDTKLSVITKDMVGRPVDVFYNKQQNEIGDPLLVVENLKLKQASEPLSFEVRRGEILGIAGMVGSGRTEIVRAISGADKFYSGNIYINNEKVNISNPCDAIDVGIAHITEDRQKLGLYLNGSISENIVIIGLGRKLKNFFVRPKKFPELVNPILKGLNIKAASHNMEVRYLSGGNQQKVVLGKWLFQGADLFIFDEPTRGIDVNSKNEFYNIMSSLTKQGKGIIMVSSDMPELVSMSDRVMVIRKGSIAGIIQKEEISENNIIKKALEVDDNE